MVGSVESQDRSLAMGDGDTPIFIVGLPRSGTTLMQSLISAHPRIAIAPETHFLNQFVAGEEEEPAGDSFETFWSTFTSSKRFDYLDLDPAMLKELIIQSGDRSYRSVFRTILREYASRQGKPRFGEKTPFHLAHISRLFAWFPMARVLYMMRDPRAVCASLMSVWWRSWERKSLRILEPRAMTRLRRVYHDAMVWQAHAEMFTREWESDPRIKEVRYEDLVETPESSLRDICEFLEEEFHSGMMEPRSRQDLIAPTAVSDGGQKGESRRAHLEKAKSQISRGSLERWKSELSTMEIETIESLCRSQMQRLDYEVDGHEGSNGPLGNIKSRVGRAWCRTYWSWAGEARD